MQLGELYPAITKKEKNNSAKILNCGHITYTGNTLKFEYLGRCTPRTAHILKEGGA